MKFAICTKRESRIGSGLLAVLVAASLPIPLAIAQNADGGEAAAGTQPPEDSVGGIGDINLYPKRVVIGQRERIASVGLYNLSTETGEYKIEIEDKMMTPEGRLVNIDETFAPEQSARVKTASDMLRWSPRRVELKGNEAQTVRIMARVSPDTPPGEYRSHFSAVALPPIPAGGLTIENAVGSSTASGIAVQIFPRFGISIPVIVRVGETTLDVSISGATLVTLPDGRRGIEMTIHRQGTRSAFGDITVTAPGTKDPVALIKGIGVYPEIDSRSVVIPVSAELEPGVLASGTRLSITYTDDDFDKGSTLARHEFVVP